MPDLDPCTMQCCGSGMFIPVPNFFHPRTRILTFSIQYPLQRSELIIPNPDPDFLPIPVPRVKKAPDPGSATRLRGILIRKPPGWVDAGAALQPAEARGEPPLPRDRDLHLPPLRGVLHHAGPPQQPHNQVPPSQDSSRRWVKKNSFIVLFFFRFVIRINTDRYIDELCPFSRGSLLSLIYHQRCWGCVPCVAGSLRSLYSYIERCAEGSVVDPDPFLDLPDPDPLVRGLDPDPALNPSFFSERCWADWK